MPVTPGKQRLTRNDFVALRSLARGNWFQGQLIEWRHNRTWRFVPYPSEALDAVFKLQGLGLVGQGICCKACNRETFYLSERGLALVKKLEIIPIHKACEASPVASLTRMAINWIKRRLRLIAPSIANRKDQ